MFGQNTPIFALHDRGWIDLLDIDQLSIESLTFTGNAMAANLILPIGIGIVGTESIFISRCCFTNLVTGYTVSVQCSKNAVMKDVVFDNNKGSAIGIIEAGTVSIENGTFTGNKGEKGGAIYIESMNATIYINNSIFFDNTASNLGGAIYVGNGEVFITHSALKCNTAVHSGGGIFVHLGSASIYNSSLIKNNATYNGGGIKVNTGSATIHDSSLISNAANHGGGINVNTGCVYVYNGTFTSNVANHGGGIYVYSGSASISIKSNFTRNTASQGGGIYVWSGNVSVVNSILTGNIGTDLGGGINVFSGSATVYKSILKGNRATYGGGISVDTGSASINNSALISNYGTKSGGGIYISGSAFVYKSILKRNRATYGGGISVPTGSTSINNSALISNYGTKSGGGIYISGSAFVYKSILKRNRATYGGGISVHTGSASINNSALISNYGTKSGGGIDVNLGSAAIQNSTVTHNTAWFGGGIEVYSGSASVYYSTLTGNSARSHGGGVHVIYLSSASVFSITCTDNTAAYGSAISVFNSVVNFNGETLLGDNNASIYGGGIETTQSTVYFNGAITISNNTATKFGGGVFLRESSLFVNSPATISHNTANEGGAIYGYQSTIEFNKTGHGNTLASNAANNSGGGIYVTASIIKLSNSFVHVESNTAKANGGGLYLQQNSKLYILKHTWDFKNDLKVSLSVSNNKALLGGGIYVNDSTSGRVCSAQRGFWGECFLQTIKLYGPIHFNTVNTFITNNTAYHSGSAIYGGLLDRCTADAYSEILYNPYSNRALPNTVVKPGLEYIRRTVELTPWDENSISSDPLQVEICNGSTSNVSVRKGQMFRLCVKALDQGGNPVNATIHGAVVTKSGVGRLKEGQVEQSVDRECIELEYNVFSEDSSAQLELYAIGPCTNEGISRLLIRIVFLNCTCPLGFHPSQSNIECRCECDSELQAAKCFPEEEIFQPDNTQWVGAAKFTECNETGYLACNCPFDYCIDQPVNTSLNSSQQIDRQCAYNRSGVLCGECEEGLSLVFASSKCKECSNTYLLLLIPFAVAGIALVVFILWLNITVATGTTYGLILYANVLAANKAIFLPFKAPNFLTVFVSWVNLDFGIETCFYDGMNSQAKVLLQLAFPAYLFLLTFLIIILSRYVNSFAKLLSNRNPVAALCTLLVLSYSKLLRLIIATLQFTTLPCSENPMVWLYDGNVQYLAQSHIPRFVAAAVILTACVLFTTLLFFGQWFPRCSKWKIMKWTKNTKYIGFMDAFHAPFAPKHRYWPGLLLFALIAHNLAASMAPDTSVPVLSAGCVSVGLNVYCRFLANSVYKNRLNSALETLFLMNVSIFALGTYHFRADKSGQLKLAYISMAIAFVFFVVITCYHFYNYVLKKTNVWNNQVRPLNSARGISINFPRNQNYKRVSEIDGNKDVDLSPVADMYSYGQGPREETNPDKYITPPIITPANRHDQLREPDLDILAPTTEEDYRQAPPIPRDKNCLRPVVTSTVVEITKDK